MGNEQLPSFRYHPDPVATGSVERSSAECVACGRCRGYIYVGPVYAEEDHTDAFCPWCIEDGSAAARFDATFTDVGFGVPDGVPRSVLDIVAGSTPGFTSLQQDHWLYHCGDACAFMGAVGREELEDHPDALAVLLHEHDDDGWSNKESKEYVAELSADGDATAYLFRCLVCGTYLAYSDSA